MRFKKGSKVEVMSKKEVPTSWRPAEIISGNGHTYNLKNDYCLGLFSKEIMERVSRKAIRPCPPPLEGVGSWMAGDVVEVFDDISWKIATVLKVLDMDNYLVRLLGFAQELKVTKFNIRVRQSWENGRWVVIGKSSASCYGGKSNKLQKASFQGLQANKKNTQQAVDNRFSVQNNAGLQDSHIISCRTLKRASPYCSSLVEACTGNAQKVRAIEKDGRSQRVFPSPLLEKGHSWRHASLASKGLKMMR